MSKYEKAKNAARSWYNMYMETKEELEKINNENTKLQAEIQRWKKLSEDLPDPELESEYKTLKKQFSESEEKYKDKIARLEREKILSEGKIQQLEEARKDLQERYSELKQDFREQQKWKQKEN